MTDAFDAARYVLRARRIADLSQRELAEAVGLSRAAIGRMETGDARIDVATFVAILRLAALRLEVVDVHGAAVPPVPADTLRDNAGRRFPSHLDVLAPPWEPYDRGVDARKGKPPATGWYLQRSRRAHRRRRWGTPPDHPTSST